ncbi:MAG: hypothetical protein F4X05_05230 [Rhodothermaceae bacterium]|nr:hypothetical protein [Rhodothermaceae bacterium]
MVRPSFFEDVSQSDRGLTAGIFTAAVICIAVVIQVVPMPSRAGMDRSLKSFVLESIAIAADTPEETEMEEVEEVVPEEPEMTMEDFDDLLSSFSSLSDAASPDVEMLETETSESFFQTELDLDFGSEETRGGLGTGLGDLNADLYSQAERGIGTALRPNIVSGLSRSLNTQLTDGIGEVSEDELTLRQEGSNRLETLALVYEGLDRSALSPEEIAREDAVVLRMNTVQSTLDPAIRALFRSKPTDLVFRGTISLNGDDLTVQLAYAPKSRTLKIALIRNKDLFYFIDPGLQNRANYCERGHIGVDSSARVVLVESEEVSVQSPDAIRMFDLFHSWWTNETLPDG